jgi:predicted nucleic acid-binding protein
MPVALLDTNAVSDLMRDHPQVKARIANHAGLLISSVIVWGEIHYGLDRLPHGKKRTALEARAQALQNALAYEPVSVPVAEEYGRLKATLEGMGLNLQDNDLWIAATDLGRHLGVRANRGTQLPCLPSSRRR